MAMETMSLEIAAAFGFRDRCLGIDSGERQTTLSRFQGSKRLENAYWRGWNEADSYASNCWRWGDEQPPEGRDPAASPANPHALPWPP
jgi:hypothetical protein